MNKAQISAIKNAYEVLVNTLACCQNGEEFFHDSLFDAIEDIFKEFKDEIHFDGYDRWVNKPPHCNDSAHPIYIKGESKTFRNNKK